MDVYQIDLSMVVSKYIGETEKNLSALFDRAKNKNWILFFDEADALFGKRSDVKDSHDRYANQQVSYLLQRVEDYSGIVILATNLKGNIDRAFSRRFQNIIKFNMPDSVQREKLWRNSFSSRTVFEHELVIPDLAKSYELSGGSIINVVQYASLKAAERGNNVILYNDVKTAILREMHKDGRTPS
jgi:SpoVK/Ycf46/Vps4 family AAA+-type ATPase